MDLKMFTKIEKYYMQLQYQGDLFMIIQLI